MKKNLLLLLLLAAFNSYGQISFLDNNFKQALIDAGIDTNTDSEISVAEAEAVTELDVRTKSISSLSGMEFFTNVEILSIGANDLTELNLTGLTKLKQLNAGSNTKSLTINNSDNLLLEHFDVQGSKVNCLDLSMLTNLKTVYINNNPISGIVDVSKSAGLIVFQIASCPNVTKICVPVGSVQAASPGNFVKEPTAVWSEACAANEGMTCPNITTSIASKSTQGKFEVFPSQFSETFNIDIDETGTFDVVIIDLLGNIVSSEKSLSKGTYTLGNNLQRGMFIVKVNGMNKFKTFKIQKI